MLKIVLAVAAVSALATGASAQTAPAHDHSAHAGHAHAAPATALPTIESSIKDLLADPATAAVIEKHLPGIGQHPALPQFQDMTRPRSPRCRAVRSRRRPSLPSTPS